MRSFKVLSGVSAGVLLALAGGAQAATDHGDLHRHRQRRASCAVAATHMDFGDLRRVGNRDATSTIKVNCTDGSRLRRSRWM